MHSRCEAHFRLVNVPHSREERLCHQRCADFEITIRTQTSNNLGTVELRGKKRWTQRAEPRTTLQGGCRMKLSHLDVESHGKDGFGVQHNTHVDPSALPA